MIFRSANCSLILIREKKYIWTDSLNTNSCFTKIFVEMETGIRRFIDVLQNNDYFFKSRLPEILDNPDAVDGNEEIISEIIDNLDEGGTLPPSLTTFFINGISNRLDMEEYLAKEFNHFKVVAQDQKLWNNKVYKDYIVEEARKAIKTLSDLKNSFRSNNDLDLNEVIDVKIKYCKLTQNLLQANLSGKIEPAEETKKNESEEEVFVYRLRPGFSNFFYEELKILHHNLKEKNLIDCALPDFRKLFINNKDGLPFSTPKPIIWKKGTYNSLSYFIKRLSERIITSDQGRPATGTFSNNQIALKLFYNQKEGQFFEPKKIGHDNDPSKTIKSIIDSVFE